MNEAMKCKIDVVILKGADIQEGIHGRDRPLKTNGLGTENRSCH